MPIPVIRRPYYGASDAYVWRSANAWTISEEDMERPVGCHTEFYSGLGYSAMGPYRYPDDSGYGRRASCPVIARPCVDGSTERDLRKCLIRIQADV